ncbi:hypothetical protein DRQ36_04410 [bacterium]|nr:MAG: hypothetical protein DRQ36_04410 [bacterium]
MSSKGRAAKAALLVNTGLVIAKIGVGLYSQSSALLADGADSLSDLIGDVFLLIGIKKAEKPPDEGHPYGHAKAECLASMALGAILLILAIGLIARSVNSFFGDIPGIPGKTALVVAGISIVLKFIMGVYLRKTGKMHRSEGLAAGSAHAFSDSATSVAALVGIYLARIGYPLADPLAGAIVAVLVARVAIKIISENVNSVMDRAAPPEVVAEVERIASTFPGVWNAHYIRTRKCGGRYNMDMHIQVGPSITVKEGHELGHSIGEEIKRKIPEIGEVLVHIEPYLPDHDNGGI